MRSPAERYPRHQCYRRPDSTLALSLAVLALTLLAGCGQRETQGKPAAKAVRILNVSYDPTRELWKDVNQAFIPKYRRETGVELEIQQSHAASGSQARAIIDGLEADVATLSIWSDTDALRKKGLLKEKWEDSFPNRSLPYTSTVVFVVRRGNPKGIKDWPDLVSQDISVITPSPKTSGNGKLSFLAAWGSVIASGGTAEQARDFVTRLYQKVPVLDTGARGATTTFAQKGIGDVHLSLESEAWLEVQESQGALEIVYPPQSILHEPHVAVVDKTVDARGTRVPAEAYLLFLYTPEGQEIIARHHFRPTDEATLQKHRQEFPPLKMFTIQDFAAGWDEAQKAFFADGAVFDQIYSAGTK
ncbi:sulfate ABC transporter substrate-binding protein [Planctomicrobium piriforme]|uniref:Sulfate transport system substrate-binding protein n=1 Tax=Planctomicrobium piriforme TaxID=1576369 RepID=A0A1I3B1K7_9PLAN|nr:sulfate ABC transporter substrate-binding protein [Planctomicrobium piriforme]SFH56060.1 sulfate transport system substrate-binding protein [Planctomicrobium piriforme]